MKQRNLKTITDPYSHKRYVFQDIKQFVDNKEYLPNYRDKVLILYGLKRTGKTTLLEQFISEMPDTDKCAFYNIDSNDTMDDVEDVIEREQKKGTKYIIFDEITLIKGFIDESASLANVYSKEGIVIILSGTDSLGFNLASKDALLGKCIKLETTHILYVNQSSF